MADYCIVSSANLRLCPYLAVYTSVLESYDIVFWDRFGFNDECEGAENVFRYSTYLHEGYSKSSAVKGYIGFASFLRKTLTAGNYKGIVVLQTQTAFLINDILATQYRKRYLLDIRDYSYEKYALFRLAEKRLVRNSYANIISSEGFKAFLPEGAYHVVHNIPAIKPDCVDSRSDANRTVISYIGKIDYFSQCQKLVNEFGGDCRFELRFIGAGSDSLNDFLDKPIPENVSFRDAYLPKELSVLYSEADVIANVYGNNDPLLDYALSNKLYCCAMLRKPILVSPNTLMEDVARRIKIGYAMDFESVGSKEGLLEFLDAFNEKDVSELCDSFLGNAMRSNDEVEELIRAFQSEKGSHS